MQGFGGRGLAPGRLGERRVHLPGRSRGPATTRSATRREAEPYPSDRSRTRQGRGRQLKAIEDVLTSLEGKGPDYAYNSPVLDCRLRTACTPQALGLSSLRNLGERGRYGLDGPPPSALQEVRQTVALMDELPGRCALTLVSLLDEDYEDLAVSGQWPIFQRSYRDRLTRYLKGQGNEALVVGVVELGEVRAKRTGHPMPHIHAVLTGWGKRDASGQWLLRAEVMDEIVLLACRDAGLPDRERPAASSVNRVRGTVRNYLSKYLSKGTEIAGVSLDDGWENLIPHQWWFRSTAAKALRDGHMWRLPPAFAAFVTQQRKRLEALGLGMARLVILRKLQSKTRCSSVDGIFFYWASVEQLLEGLEWFAVWCTDPQAFEREADRCTSLRTLACDGADVGLPPAQEKPLAVVGPRFMAFLNHTPGAAEVFFPDFRLQARDHPHVKAAGSPLLALAA